jgi:hypothetical protein
MVKKRLPRRCIQRAFKSIKYLPRDCIQRVFLRWLNENRTSFNVTFRLGKITSECVELHFNNYPGCLSACLSRVGLGVYVEWEGQPWDALIDYDAYMHQVSGGYKCDLCVHENGESAELFPTREALWLDHLFLPFLKWVNETLVYAHWLRISCINDRGCTWAKLIQNEEKLSEPDRTLNLMQQLKRLDDRPVYDGDPDGVTNWLLPLKSESCC